jgi:chaperonin GroEL
MGKLIIRGQKARDGILSGIIEAGSTVEITFGPRGRTITYNKGTDTIPTKDGITVLKNVSLSDELKDQGVKLIKEASDKSNKKSGDGSTSTAILTKSLCCAANTLLNQGININDLRIGFKAAYKFTLESLEKFKHNVSSEEDMKNIALISSNGDEEIANNIVTAFSSIGDGGLVSYADSMSTSGKSMVKVTKGMELTAGYVSSRCVNSSNDQCLLEKAKVFLFKNMIEDVESFKLLIMPALKNGCVVIAPEFSDDIKSYYISSLADKSIAFIRSPGADKVTIDAYLRDLEVVLNTKIIGEDIKIEDFKVNTDCGIADFAISSNNTVITNPSTDQERFDKYIEELKDSCNVKDDVELSKSPYEIDFIKNRLARLTGGIATIFIGAISKPELSEKKDRYDDAIHSVRNSLTEGYVIGAGTTLLRISYSDNKESESLTLPQMTAYKAYMKAIRRPAQLLIYSANEDTEIIIPKILNNELYGFDARAGKVTDLLKEGIVDPYNVIINSILYSENLAEQFMSIDCAIVSDVKNMEIESLDSAVDPGRIFGGLDGRD